MLIPELVTDNALTLHELFEAQVERTPEAIALVCENERLTYRELNERSNQIAHYLRSLNVGSETLVGICIERSIETIVGMLGILKAGGAFVPLDPSLPQERLEFILADTKVEVMITLKKLLAEIPIPHGHLVCLDTEAENISSQSKNNPVSGIQSENLAYTIYTSGSTGQPKGVMVSHQAVCQGFLWMQEIFPITQSDRILQKLLLTFDFSFWELFWPLMNGASVVLAKPNGEKDSAYLVKLIAQQEISVLVFVPSVLQVVLSEDGLEKCRNIRMVFTGGEPLTSALKDRFFNQFPNCKLYDLFGATENIVVTYWPCQLEENVSGFPQGRLFPNLSIYVVDEELQPVPEGEKGELLVGGWGLARGYLSRPELTAQKFISNPFQENSQERLYRTGDLVRYLGDDTIEILGRIDHQVKIRGFRIELGEIEENLSKHPSVKQATITAREDVPGDKRLVAYLVLHLSPESNFIRELRQFLQQRLPDYMIPSHFVVLESLPLNPNGKVNRRALPKPEINPAELSTFVAPRTAIEEILAGIWAEILRVERVGVDDNFFELGGHSLLATQIIARIRDRLKVELPFSRILEYPTVAGLALIVEEVLQQEQRPIGIALQPISRNQRIPLSFSQEQLWFLAQVEPNIPVYNEPCTIRFPGAIDVDALEKALNAIINRHESLRTRFRAVDGQPVMVIEPFSTLNLTVINLKHLPEQEREAEALRLAKIEAIQPFDLSSDLLLRATLMQLSDKDYRLFLTFHHIIIDAVSLYNIFLKELAALYKAFSTSQALTLAELPVQYADFAVWQRQLFTEEILENRLNYWKQQLADLPVLELPLDHSRPPIQTFRGARQGFALSKDLTAALKSLSRKEGVTLYTTLLAAFKTLLYRYSGQEDIVVGTVSAGRNQPEIEGLIGFFVNTLVLRTNVSGNPSFQELLFRVRAVTLAAYAYEDLPFEKLVEILQPERKLTQNPLFQVAFTAQPLMPSLSEGWTLSYPDINTDTAKFDLTLDVEERLEGIVGWFEYNADLFEASAIARMIGHFQTLLSGIVADPKTQVSELPLLTPAERHQLLVEWNNTTKDYAQDKCIHQLFEAQAEKTPNAIGVVFQNQQLTYAELNIRANQLAHHLQTLRVKSEVLVGICVERSIEMIVGLLGIFKAGGAYVPLDPSYPQERLAYMLSDSQVSILLTQSHLLEILPEHDRVVCLDTDWQVIAQHSPKNPVSQVESTNLAYVIYTSGSTGKPKGTMIIHQGVVNYLSWCTETYAVAEGTGAPVQSSFAFDATITSLLSPLIVGQQVVLLPDKQEIEALCDVLRSKRQFSLVKLTPAHLELLNQFIPPEEASGQSNAFVIGGEALFGKSLQFWRQNAPETRLINEYGPTETVVGCCIYEVTDDTSLTSGILIGRPIANTQLYILDEYLQPVPIGVRGELYIAGAGVARGYLNRPELTQEKFITNPFSHELGARMYKTGDLACYLPDGNIKFLGRIDNQVKIRGFRIELGEIETAISQHPSVQQTVVIVTENNLGNKQLVAYILPQPQAVPTSSNLRHFLKQKLPDYMVPATFIMLETFPLTPNGKIDKKALPKPEITHQQLATTKVIPQTSTQKILASIWTEVLQIKLVGIHDNFFELGGDSILSIQIIARCHQANLKLTPKDLFQNQTIAELAQIVTPTTEITAEQGLVTGIVPLTPIQHWFVEQNLPEPYHFNQSFLFEISPNLNPELLQQVIQQLLLHHDALRLRLIPNSDTWQLLNASTEDSKIFSTIDLSQIASTEQIAAIETTANQLQASLNLLDGPIIRVTLFHLGNHQPNRLLIIIHHLAVDGVSWRILLEDLITAYQQLSRGETIQLPAKTTSFQDWAIRLTQYAQTQTAVAELNYWLTQENCDIAPLPVDYPAEIVENQIADTAVVTVTLSAEQTSALLKEVPKAYNTQINDVLLTALAQSFAQWTGQTSLLIDLEGHGREELFESVNLSRTVGWFTSIFPVLLKLEQAELTGKSLKSIKEQLRHIPQRGIGYGIISYLTQNETIRQQLQLLPQAQVSFNYLGQFDQMLSAFPILGLAKESSGSDISLKGNRSHLIEIDGFVADGKLEFTWAYNTKVHKRATIERLANSFVESLTGIIFHCSSSDAFGYTPTDFPDTDLTQTELDELVESLTPRTLIESIYPLSPMQEGMLFHTLYAPNSGVYFEQLVLTLSGNLNVSAFEQAWRRVVELHPILRTFFVWKNRQHPLQLVCKSVNLPWHIYDWSSLSSGEKEEHLDALLEVERERGFELDKAPLMCFSLIQFDDDNYQFVWSHHHLLMDGWCLPIVLKQVWAFYEAMNQGEHLYLDAPPPYRNYIAWLQRQDSETAQEFWRKQLTGFTAPTPMVVDKFEGNLSQLSQQKQIYDERNIKLSATLTDALKEFARQNHLTLNTLVQGAWALLLSRYSGESDVVFGATVSGRPPALSGVELIVGLFINTLPVRVQISPETELLSWLKQLQAQQVEQQQYSYSPLVEIQGLSDVPRNLPLFNSIVVFENCPVDSSLLEGKGSVEIKNVQGFERTNYPLTVTVLPGRELSIQISYDATCFDDDTVSRMLRHLQTLLSGMIAQEHGRVGELPLLTPGEKQQILVQWNNTFAEYPQDKCIHQLFEEQVELSPSSVAVVFEGEQLTYQELNAKSNQLAHYLRSAKLSGSDSLGVGTEVLVGICVERSPLMVIGLLGILKAGGAYVPIDPNYPFERKAFMLEDSAVPVLLTQSKLIEKLPPSSAHVVCLDSDWSEIADYSEENLSTGVKPENLAYVIYTSGSTGKPKGVLIEHRSLVNYTIAAIAQYQIQKSDRILQFASISFDASAEEIYPCLTSGATLVLRTDSMLDSFGEFLQKCRDWNLTVLSLPTAYWHELTAKLSQENLVFPPSLRLIIIGGEKALPERLKTWLLCVGQQVRLVNTYGPTEATVVATVHELSAVDTTLKDLPIGRPLPNIQTYILDRNGQPVPVGVPGELHIGGAGLARGYLNQPNLTDERFIRNPFNDSPTSRLYKTGDLVRYLPDGNIEYLDRIDNQVKIRGFRIEIGEIEQVLAQYPDVQEAVVVAREDIPGNKRLVAYIVSNLIPERVSYQIENVSVKKLAEEQGLLKTLQHTIIDRLRDYLKQKLPDYMIPSAFVLLEAIPLTHNGKLDRHALIAPDSSHFWNETCFVDPHDTLELQLSQIWSEVLGIYPVGVRDNFFTMGGHSLLAVRLMTRIEQQFGTNLPLATLFSSPTIEQLAIHIRSSRDSGKWSPLIPIHSSGSKKPFFCVPGIGGNVLYFYDLARHLGSDQPFYGLQARGLDGESEPFTQVEDMAAYYIQGIQTVQSQGPYLLGGHSFGGLVVFEIAQQLQKQGHEVTLVAIIDAVAPIFSEKSIAVNDNDLDYTEFANYMEYMFYPQWKLSKQTLASLTQEEQLDYLKEKWSELNSLPNDVASKSFKGLVEVYKANTKAYRNYYPEQVLPTRISVFRAREIDAIDVAMEGLTDLLKNPALGWSKFSTTNENYLIPGNHMTMMQKPHVEELAAQLKVSFDVAQSHSVEL